MCILFFHVKKLSIPGKFRVVIVSNRDEFLKRPTAPAHFWKENLNVFGGRDLQTGDEGGTWLAVSRLARLAVLLNITSGTSMSGAQSRGHLVPDFVTTGVSGLEYQSKVAREAVLHNPFHMLTMEIRASDVRVLYVAGVGGGEVICEDLSPSGLLTNSLSNSPLPRPYRKAEEGAAIFQGVLDQMDDTSQREQLIASLISFAKTDTRFLPDPVLAQQTHLNPHLDKFSSIYVDIPEMDYGTRTHTVVLVDDQGRMDVIESTMRTDCKGWQETRQTFQLDLKDAS